jgi:hypothetical protein
MNVVRAVFSYSCLVWRYSRSVEAVGHIIVISLNCFGFIVGFIIFKVIIAAAMTITTVVVV